MVSGCPRRHRPDTPVGPVAGNDFLATAKNIGTAPDTLYVSAICVTVAG